MLVISQSDIDLILAESVTERADSNLGFFSKPFRINYKDRQVILKKYLPVRNWKLISSIIKNHESYISELKKLGIKVPDTIITTLKTEKKFQINIIQEAFPKSDLLRNMIEKSSHEELLNLCKKILDEAMIFWTNKNKSADIGFHPTLRNFAMHGSDLFYFDTFPPMLMKQWELNNIILKMSPFGKLFKIFIPLSLINIVSNEYYNIEKMLTGIIGSCCRLRPEYSSEILAFGKEYISNSLCTESEKQNILRILNSPPRLSGIWTFLRSLSGNVGKPNVKSHK
jgi:hypothetical protein